MDLGREINHEGPHTQPSAPKQRTSYPSFQLSDETAAKFSEEYDCEVGDILTATVKLRVSGLRKDEYGHSITLDVQSIDNVKEEGDTEEKSGDENEPDSEEKILGYKRPQGNKETPPISDLAD